MATVTHMELIAVNAVGRTRRATLNGRDYLIAPLTLIVPGVLNGSKGALFYPPEEVERDPHSWNHTPIVVYHPVVGGRHVSGRQPSVLEKQGIGHVYNVTADPKLRGEGWFDIEATKRVDMRVWNALERGEPIELSTGLYTDNVPAMHGATYNGKGYDYIAKNYRPDHLAILPDQIGACSVQDGCGVLVNSLPTDLQPGDTWEKVTIKGQSLYRLHVNSNPEGINQYTSGGRFAASQKAHEATSKIPSASTSTAATRARDNSEKAIAASNSGDSKGAAIGHTRAAAYHTEQANDIVPEGTQAITELHSTVAKTNRDAAKAHEEAAKAHSSPHSLDDAIGATQLASTHSLSKTAGMISHDANLDNTKVAHLGAAKAHLDAAEVTKGNAASMHKVAAKLHKRESVGKPTDNQLGKGNWSLKQRSSYADDLSQRADTASEDATSDPSLESHQAALEAHQGAAMAHRGAAIEAATGRATGSQKDYSLSGRHSNKASYHDEKAQGHQAECDTIQEMTTDNSNPEGHNQYTGSGSYAHPPSADLADKMDAANKKFTDAKSKAAHEKSEIAEKSGSKRDHQKASEFHEKAASAHSEAAMGTNSPQVHAYHKQMEAEHDRATEYHSKKVTTNQSGTNNMDYILTNAELGAHAKFKSDAERARAFAMMVDNGATGDPEHDAMMAYYRDRGKDEGGSGVSTKGFTKQEHTGRSTEPHSGKSGPEKSEGSGRGTQEHTGRSGPTKAEPKQAKEESKPAVDPKKAEEAKTFSEGAAKLSKLAKQQGTKGAQNLGKSARAHERAARSHEFASQAHREAGNDTLAAHHASAAAEHASLSAERYQTLGVTKNSLYDVDDYPLLNREDSIDWLVSNCSCWKEEDRDTLNTMSDSKLDDLREQSLIARNAAMYGGDPDGDDDEEEEDEDGDGLYPGRKGMKGKRGMMNNQRREATAPTNNGSSKPMAMKDMLANATEEDRQVWNTAVAINKKEKERLLNQLIANVAPARRKAIWDKHKGKSIPQLQELLELLPTDNHSYEDSHRSDSEPVYYGASGGPVENQYDSKDADDVLPMLTMNYSGD